MYISMIPAPLMVMSVYTIIATLDMSRETPSMEKYAFFQADDTLQMLSRRVSLAALSHVLAPHARQ